ncbi:MAG: RluA family pseudouridine synthase [Patescibacteria group bacterium]
MHAQFTVASEDKGKRLDKLLVERTVGLSRSQIQRDIKEGKWTVDGKAVSPHYALKEGQNITCLSHARPPQSGTSTEMLSSLRDPLLVKEGTNEVKVIAETDDYLVVDKPAGIAVHPTAGMKDPTLVDVLIGKYPTLRGVGEDPLRPGIVHRIDKQVSGILVVARNQDFFNYLKEQFQKRLVKKEYTALVYGRFVNDEGTINLSLIRKRGKRKRGTIKAVPTSMANGGAAREAFTRFEVVQRYPNFTLLRVFPETGRTHQIRVHCAAIGHPIIGDSLYRTKLSKRIKIPLHRPFLHATSITFMDKEGKVQKYQSKLPDELGSMLSASINKSQ